ELAWRLHVREGRLHLRLPRAVLSKRTSLNGLPLRVEAHQVSGELPGVLLGFSQRALPLTSRKLVQLRVLVARVQILLDSVKLVSGHKELIRHLVLDEQELFLDAL